MIFFHANRTTSDTFPRWQKPSVSKTKIRLGVESLEDRVVPATVVLPESTFDPEVFGQNVHDIMDFNVVGYAYGVSQNGVANVTTGTGGLDGPDLGYARTSADNPAAFFETDTKVDVASVSKIITTVAVLHLLDSISDDTGISVDNLLSTPISEYLPPAPTWEPGAWVNTVTIRHLLTHTSPFTEGGAGDVANPIGVNFESFAANNFQNLRAMYEADYGIPTFGLPDGSFGWQRNYSNVNFSLLAKMVPYMRSDVDNDTLDFIANVLPGIADSYFGNLYEEYVRDNILTPAGINNASMSVTVDNPAVGYNYDDAEDESGYSQSDFTDRGGAFGWKLSAPELASFMNALYHDDLLSNSTRDLMHNEDFLLGWSPGNVSGVNPYILAPTTDEWGSYYRHNGAAGSSSGSFKSIVVAFPGDIQAAMVINNETATDNVDMSRFQVLKTSYINAWSELVIEGDGGDNVFEVRLNTDDPGLIDIVVDDETIATPSVDVLTSLEFRGLGGNDIFIIEDQPESLDLILNGGSGNDTFELGNTVGNSVFTYLEGNLTILGGDNTDHLDIMDDNGIGSDYSIIGLNNGEIQTQGTIDASGYTVGKLFQFDDVEEIVLEANTQANNITVTNIPSGMTVDVYGGFNNDSMYVSNIESDVTINLYGQYDHDSFSVWNTAVDSVVNVFGEGVLIGTGSDTLTVGNGDLGSVQGIIEYHGHSVWDSLILDDTSAPVGRNIDFNFDPVTQLYVISGSHGFGEVHYAMDVEDVVLDAGKLNDTINVEALYFFTDLELFGNHGSDIFYIGGTSHAVDDVAGDVVIHGGSGLSPNDDPDDMQAENDDHVYVYDENTASTGDYTLNHFVNYMFGQLNKQIDLGTAQWNSLNVIYDEIEQTFLQADDGDNTIQLNEVPRFNQFWAYAGGGADTIEIEMTALDANPMHIYGQAGDDTVHVSPDAEHLGFLYSELVVDGGTHSPGGQDYLLVSDASSGNMNPYLLTNSVLTRTGSSAISYTSIDNLGIALSDADNHMAVASTAPGTLTVIQGLDGDDSLTASGLASMVYFYGGNGTQDSATFLGTNGEDTITVTGATLTLGSGSLTSYTEHLEVNGMARTDRLHLVGTSSQNEAFEVFPSTTPYQGRVHRNPFEAIHYQAIEEMLAEGNVGNNDTLEVNGQTDPWSIGGGSYHDRFWLNLGAAGTSADPFMRLYQGRTTLLTLVDYADVGVPKFNGLLGADTFIARVSPTADSSSRHIEIDGGGHPAGSMGDLLMVQAASHFDTFSLTNFTPVSGEVEIDYGALLFTIDFDDVEQKQYKKI